MSKPRSGEAGKVLVVEDEPRLVQLLRAILESAHYQVLVANTGERAIEQAALEGPDLILLDLLLPASWTGSPSAPVSASSR